MDVKKHFVLGTPVLLCVIGEKILVLSNDSCFLSVGSSRTLLIDIFEGVGDNSNEKIEYDYSSVKRVQNEHGLNELREDIAVAIADIIEITKSNFIYEVYTVNKVFIWNETIFSIFIALIGIAHNLIRVTKCHQRYQED
jgi:hypothetical protein